MPKRTGLSRAFQLFLKKTGLLKINYLIDEKVAEIVGQKIHLN